MYATRLLSAVGTSVLGGTLALVGTVEPAHAAVSVPKSFTVARAADTVFAVQATWKPVTDVDHYVLDILAGNVQTTVDLPASATGYRIDAPNPCTDYKVSVGAVDAAGNVATSGIYSLRALTPGAVMGLAPTREEGGTVAKASWRVPAWAGYTPLTGYRVVFTRLSDGVVLHDETSAATSFQFPGVDPARAYTLAVSTVNEFGSCVTAKSLMDRFRPADPTGLVVERLAGNPGTVDVVWKAPTTGPAPQYYQVNYGPSKITKTLRVEAPVTTARLALDVDKSWVVEVKAYNDNGGSSAVTGSVPVWEPTTPTPGAAVPAPGEADVSPSTSSTIVDNGPDRTPPTITTTLSQKASNGWFRTPTTIRFTCADDSGAVATCPADVVAMTDGTAQRYSGTARDAAGNATTTTLTMKVDQTAPVISSTVVGARNDAGWYATPPTIRYTCSDAVSLISACPADTTVRVDGADQKITGIAWDKAGNSATAPVTLSVDQTAPVITATLVAAANLNGWHRTAPVVRFTCTDQGSGIADCPTDRTVTADGANQVITGTTTDKAGNTATTAVTVNVDQAAPAITATVLTAPNAGGWHRTAPVVRFTCTDQGSGIADCPADRTVTADGANQVITGTATDKAGNTATGTATVNIDRTAPVVTVVGAANGSFHLPDSVPPVSCSTTDAVSGVLTQATTTRVISGEKHTVTCKGGVDRAGNTAAAVQVTYTVAPTVEWLTALTHKYMPTASANTLRHLGADLAAGRYTAYTARVSAESRGARPAIHPTDAATLAHWAAVLAKRS